MNKKTEYIVAVPWEAHPDEQSPDERAFRVLDGGGFEIAHDLTQGAAERIVACVNACKDISTEHLTQFPNWKLAVGNMARPGDVANLILKLGTYRETLTKIANRTHSSATDTVYELSIKFDASIHDAREALK